VKYCDQRACMSLYLSLLVHLYISKTTCPIFTKFPVHVCMLPYAVAWSTSEGNAIRSVLPFLQIMGLMGQSQARCYVSPSMTGGSMVANYYVYKCLVFQCE